MTNQKLYTAAEAHRIDIERGGQGCIINFYTTQKWFGDHFNQEAWLPVTPEPEKIKEVCSPTYQELEAENAELRKKLQSQDETSKLTELGKLILQLNKKAWEMREDL